MSREIIATRDQCVKVMAAVTRLHKKGHQDLMIPEITIERFKEAYIDETHERLEDIVWRCLRRITRSKPDEYDAIVFGLSDDEADSRRVVYFNILEAEEKSREKYAKSISRKDKETNGKQKFKHNQIKYAQERGLLSIAQAKKLLAI